MSAPDRRTRRLLPWLPMTLALAWSLAPPGAAPAPAGTPRMQMYFAADFTDQAYQKKTYRKVASAWKRPAEAPKEGAKTVVIVRIQRDGQAPEPSIHMVSGSEPWDKAALDAIKGAAPFDPLPTSYRGASVEVHFHFEYAR